MVVGWAGSASDRGGQAEGWLAEYGKEGKKLWADAHWVSIHLLHLVTQQPMNRRSRWNRLQKGACTFWTGLFSWIVQETNVIPGITNPVFCNSAVTKPLACARIVVEIGSCSTKGLDTTLFSTKGLEKSSRDIAGTKCENPVPFVLFVLLRPFFWVQSCKTNEIVHIVGARLWAREVVRHIQFQCSDITYDQFGISEETGFWGRNLPIYWTHMHHLVVVLTNLVRCITPHSSCIRGYWPEQLLLYSQIFTVNIYRQRTAKFSHFLSNHTVFAGSGCLPPPWGRPKKEATWLEFPSLLQWILLRWKPSVFSSKKLQGGLSLSPKGRGNHHQLNQWWIKQSSIWILGPGGQSVFSNPHGSPGIQCSSVSAIGEYPGGSPSSCHTTQNT